MILPDPRIIKFFKDHHVLTMATASGNKPWCSVFFYVFMENEVGFVFTSDFDSRHIQEALANTYVSGSVVLESDIPGKTQGAQFEGKLKILDQAMTNKAKIAYLKKFPMAALTQTTLWYLEISYIKFTDNRLGQGNKLNWKR